MHSLAVGIIASILKAWLSGGGFIAFSRTLFFLCRQNLKQGLIRCFSIKSTNSTKLKNNPPKKPQIPLNNSPFPLKNKNQNQVSCMKSRSYRLFLPYKTWLGSVGWMLLFSCAACRRCSFATVKPLCSLIWAQWERERADQLQPGIRKSCNALLQLRHFKVEIMNSSQEELSWHLPLLTGKCVFSHQRQWHS